MKKILNWLARAMFVACLLLIQSCAQNPALFQHDQTPPPSPWLGKPIESSADKFTFAIISDLNGGEREGIFNVAAAQLKQLRPDFIISVGDLINGESEDEAKLLRQWDSFDRRADKAGAPFFRVGGNHDFSNVTMWKTWNERYGPRYYYFIYRDVLFMILDSEDFSEQLIQKMYHATPEEFKKIPEKRVGQIGEKQSSYFEQVLATNTHVKWTFLFMHKPTWLREDDKGLKRIEAALNGRSYTVFNGHFHNLSHRTRKGMDYIILGTTGGSQNIKNDKAFDHLTLVTMDKDGPSISHIRMDGLLDKTGNIPENGNHLCYQKSRCGKKRK